MTSSEIVRILENAGFGGIKIELEANASFSGQTCNNCAGVGRTVCHSCDGDRPLCSTCQRTSFGMVEPGYHFAPGGFCPECCNLGPPRCETCHGYGDANCSYCDGFGAVNNRTPAHLLVEEHFSQALLQKGLTDKVSYWRAYNDGSVDTEITLTIETRNLKYLPSLIQTFSDACCEASQGNWDVENAGMHISLMGTTDYNDFGLDSELMRLYTERMDRLAPALYALATGNNSLETRSFQYREPKVSDWQKYSAIFTHGGRMLEWRIFDPCYDEPRRVLGFLGVIAKTIETFWTPVLDEEVEGILENIDALDVRENWDLNVAYEHTDAYEFKLALTLLHPEAHNLGLWTESGIPEVLLKRVSRSIGTLVAA